MNIYLRTLTNEELLKLGWEKSEFEIELVKRLIDCIDELEYINDEDDLEYEVSELNDEICDLHDQVDRLEITIEELGCENVRLNQFILELRNKLQLLGDKEL